MKLGMIYLEGFFLLFSYLTLVFKRTLLIPRLAFLPTNFHGLEMLGGLFPCWFFPRLVPSFLLKALGVRFISRRALSLSLNPVVRNTQMFGTFSLLQSDSALEIPILKKLKSMWEDRVQWGWKPGFSDWNNRYSGFRNLNTRVRGHPTRTAPRLTVHVWVIQCELSPYVLEGQRFPNTAA